MSMLYWMAGAVALGLAVYLVWALSNAEEVA